MTNGVRVDIEGQFNPDNPLKSCHPCFTTKRKMRRNEEMTKKKDDDENENENGTIITMATVATTTTSTNTTTVTNSLTRGLYVNREQLEEDLQEDNWVPFCDDVDLEMSRLDKIKCVYYPLSGLMAFLFVMFVWVPILLLREAFFSVENGGFNLGFYLGWIGVILVPFIAFCVIRFHIHVVSYQVFEEVKDVCEERSIMNQIRYELHEEKWSRCCFGSRRFIIVRNIAQNSNHVKVEYVDSD